MGGEEHFPVPEGHIPRLTVPPKRLEAWRQVAHDEIMYALSTPHSWYNAFKEKTQTGFQLLADLPRLKSYIRGIPNSADKDLLIRSTLNNITLDELIPGMYADTTYDIRCCYAHMYEKYFLDGGLLQAEETKTDEDPLHFVGMKWAALRSPVPSLAKSRDFIFFSYDGTAYDVDGNRVLFRFLRTMPMDDLTVDDSLLPPYLVRGKISNLHLYRQVGKHVHAYTKAMQSHAGHVPSWVVTKTISNMYPGILNMETISDARMLLSTGIARLNMNQVQPDAIARSQQAMNAKKNRHSSICGVCFQRLKIMGSKRRCHGCRQDVCKRCVRHIWLYDPQKEIASTSCANLEFCFTCLRSARIELRHSIRRSYHTISNSFLSQSSYAEFEQRYNDAAAYGMSFTSQPETELFEPYSTSLYSSDVGDHTSCLNQTEPALMDRYGYSPPTVSHPYQNLHHPYRGLSSGSSSSDGTRSSESSSSKLIRVLPFTQRSPDFIPLSQDWRQHLDVEHSTSSKSPYSTYLASKKVHEETSPQQMVIVSSSHTKQPYSNGSSGSLTTSSEHSNDMYHYENQDLSRTQDVEDIFRLRMLLFDAKQASMK